MDRLFPLLHEASLHFALRQSPLLLAPVRRNQTESASVPAKLDATRNLLLSWPMLGEVQWRCSCCRQELVCGSIRTKHTGCGSGV
jgi:hypothetical protein